MFSKHPPFFRICSLVSGVPCVSPTCVPCAFVKLWRILDLQWTCVEWCVWIIVLFRIEVLWSFGFTRSWRFGLAFGLAVDNTAVTFCKWWILFRISSAQFARSNLLPYAIFWRFLRVEKVVHFLKFDSFFANSIVNRCKNCLILRIRLKACLFQNRNVFFFFGTGFKLI